LGISQQDSLGSEQLNDTERRHLRDTITAIRSQLGKDPQRFPVTVDDAGQIYINRYEQLRADPHADWDRRWVMNTK
jgi:hypothetical protein